MTEPKRARDVRVGDVLPDGSTVLRVASIVRGYSISVRCPNGSRKLMRYASDTIVRGPEDPHPSRFEGGHPWDRKSRMSSGNR